MDSTEHSERYFSKLCIVTYGRRAYFYKSSPAKAKHKQLNTNKPTFVTHRMEKQH